MPKKQIRTAPEFGYDPVWRFDFLDIRLKKLSRTAFIMRQMYRVFRDRNTNCCELSDYQIRDFTGWHLRAIKKAREQLIHLGEITPKGYCTYLVAPFLTVQEAIAQKAILSKNNNSPKGDTGIAQKAINNSPKGDTGIAQKATSQSHYIYTDTDKTDSFSASPVSKEETGKTTESVSREDMLTPEGIRTLKMLYGNNVIAIKAKLALMGITEAEADQALGRA